MTIEHAVRVLNELLAADPDATNELFRLEVTVNQRVCDHPTIQVGGDPAEIVGTLRPLGLINGLVQDGNKVVVMVTDDPSTTIIRFVVGILEDGRVSVPTTADAGEGWYEI